MEVSPEIKNFISSQKWNIDPMYGMEQLTAFILANQNPDGDTAELRQQRMKSEAITIIDPDNGGTVTKAYKTDEIPDNRAYLAKLEYSGPMRMDDGLCSVGIKTFTDQLYETSQKSNIEGILLYIHTGGGASDSGWTLNSVVDDIDKPIVAVSPFLGSAGYMGMAPADLIIGMSNLAQFGSIGALISVDKAFWEFYNENFKNIYSSLSPEKNAVARAIKDEDDKTIVEYLDEHVKLFHSAVETSRKLNPATKESTLKGGMFAALDAKERGLIDGIGGYNYAIRRLNSIIKNKI